MSSAKWPCRSWLIASSAVNLFGSFQLQLDQRFEVLRGHAAARYTLAVHEERRRRVHPEGVADRDVRLHLLHGLRLLRVEIGELAHVGRGAADGGRAQLVLVHEEPVLQRFGGALAL